MGAHGVQHRQGVHQIIGVILQRFTHALPHRLERGKMNHGLDIRMLSEQCLDPGGVAQIHLDKGNGLPHNFLHPADRLTAGIDQIVGNHDVVACMDELHTGMAANIAGAAADQNRHIYHSLLYQASMAIVLTNRKKEMDGFAEYLHDWICRTVRPTPPGLLIQCPDAADRLAVG